MLNRSIHSSFAAIAMGLAMEAAAKTPVIDTAVPQPVTSISREQLESLPAGRRIEDLIKTCPAQTFPTITRDSQMHIDGQPVSNQLSINCLAPTDIEMIQVYTAHNAARAEYGAPPLARDPALELSAGDYVGTLARTGKMVHAPRAGRGNIRENISQGQPWWSTQQLLGSWLKEKQNFIPGTFPNVSRTGNWYDIGHWAQMIWVKTVVIGCARAAGIGATWMVCRYGPGGNKDGELVGVPPPARPYLVEAPKLPPAEVFGPNARDMVSLGDIPMDIYVGDAAVLNHDYGYDPGLFVGYDLGAFRLESEVAYKKADQAASADDGNASLFELLMNAGTPSVFKISGESLNEMFDELSLKLIFEQIDDPTDTKVEQPELPKGEVFKPDPGPLEDPM